MLFGCRRCAHSVDEVTTQHLVLHLDLVQREKERLLLVEQRCGHRFRPLCSRTRRREVAIIMAPMPESPVRYTGRRGNCLSSYAARKANRIVERRSWISAAQV